MFVALFQLCIDSEGVHQAQESRDAFHSTPIEASEVLPRRRRSVPIGCQTPETICVPLYPAALPEACQLSPHSLAGNARDFGDARRIDAERLRKSVVDGGRIGVEGVWSNSAVELRLTNHPDDENGLKIGFENT